MVKGNGKLFLCFFLTELHAIFTSALDGGEWLASRPGRFIPGEEPLVPIR
jgi:hypothetical protein